MKKAGLSITLLGTSPDARFVVSGGEDTLVHVSELEWDHEFPARSDWHEGARPYLEIFLELHQGRWDKDAFKNLIRALGLRGYAWLDSDKVRKRLEQMTKRFATDREEWLRTRYGLAARYRNGRWPADSPRDPPGKGQADR